MNTAARELAAESNLALPDHAFVFFMHQGYQFLFFLLNETEDPQIYAFEDGDSGLEPIGLSFSQWLAEAARDEIRIIQGL